MTSRYDLRRQRDREQLQLQQAQTVERPDLTAIALEVWRLRCELDDLRREVRRLPLLEAAAEGRVAAIQAQLAEEANRLGKRLHIPLGHGVGVLVCPDDWDARWGAA